MASSSLSAEPTWANKKSTSQQEPTGTHTSMVPANSSSGSSSIPPSNDPPGLPQHYSLASLLADENGRPSIIHPPPGFSGQPVVLRHKKVPDDYKIETNADGTPDYSAAVRRAIQFPETLPIPLPIALAIYADAQGGSSSNGGVPTVRDKLLPDIFGSSRAWVSPQERVRLNYKKFQADMYHLGTTESFVLPKTEAEFAGLMADLHSASARHLAGRAHRLQREKDRQAELLMLARRVPPEMRGKTFEPPMDGLSAVLCMPSSFNSIWTARDLPPDERVDWPSAQQFTHDGDNRIRKGEEFRRFLPAPRKNTLDPRIAAKLRKGKGKASASSEPGPDTPKQQSSRSRVEDHEIPPWAARQIVGDRWDLHNYERHEDKYDNRAPVEIAERDAPHQIQALIAEMDMQFDFEE